MATGDKKLIPHEHTFQKRFSCQQRHPGLCYSADSDVYTSALQVAKNIEAWCTADKLHGYARIYNPDDDNVAQVLYIADKRSRRTYSPQVVVFALCAETAWPGSRDAEVRLCEGPQGNGYHFKSAESSIYLSTCLPVCLSACLPACLPVCLSACLSACLPACLPVCLVDFGPIINDLLLCKDCPCHRQLERLPG